MSSRNIPPVPDRIRHMPRSGWSWIERRFTRECLTVLGRDAILLYFFLAAVSDRNGLSYYAEGTIASRLKIDVAGVVDAREELLSHDLVAYRAPLYQVLSWPEERTPPRATEPQSIGSFLDGCLPPSARQGSLRQKRGCS